ncbi:biological adhesion [Mactra antiquata]
MFTQVLIFSDNDKIHFGKKVILQSSTMTDVDSIIRHVISTDIKSCINECKLRSNCDAVNYHRLLQLCYIIRSSQSNDIVDLPTSPGFIYGSKTDWNTNLNCNSCSLTETCNNTSGFQQCQVKECGTPPEQTNALYKGNKRSVGSKIAYYCTNYTDMSVTSTYISECHTNGQWSSTDFICEGMAFFGVRF